MSRPHLLLIPYPAQGHVMPLMALSHSLVDHGFRITFVNAEFIHRRVVSASSKIGDYEEFINLVSIPDGLESDVVRNEDHANVAEVMMTTMPGHFEDLIKKINRSNSGHDRITCVIADMHVGWALEAAQKLSIPRAAVWPASSLCWALILHLPKLIEDGICNEDGTIIENQTIQLSSELPAININQIPWQCLADAALQKALFKLMSQNIRCFKLADYFICNSFTELELPTFALLPNIKPIGPLSGSSRLAQLFPEDSTCLGWLDQQEVHSVIYVAFGSTTVLDKLQFDEIALGLELSGQPFLWVVRPDLTEFTDVYPDGFRARVGSRGMIIGWAPQREVLAHPSVGCFITHCGWNSVMEGVSNGVPLLCWPYFADQFLNKMYICDFWKTGLGLNPDENGIISREEIKEKIARLLGDKDINASALKYKELAVNNISNGGASLKNFEDFVQRIK